LRKTVSVGLQGLLDTAKFAAATRTISLKYWMITPRSRVPRRWSGSNAALLATMGLWCDARRNRQVLRSQWNVDNEDAAFIWDVANLDVPAVCPDGFPGNRES
jgi:hypothetical protein